MGYFKTHEDELSHKVYMNLLTVLSIVSCLSIFFNVILNFPLEINNKWMILITISLITLYFLKRDQSPWFWKGFFTIFMTFLFLPYAWFDSGGSTNSIVAYFFLLMICTTFFYWGKKRSFFIYSQVAVFTILLIVEHNYPELVKQYDPDSIFIDRLYQLPITLLMGYRYIRIFANAYRKERKQLNHLVHHDSLTDLYNRRSFDIFIEEIISEKKASENSCYLIFMDMDDFKNINDEKGHHIGDKVLLELAEHIKNVLKPEDIVARWGGDEFAIIYKGTESELLSALTRIHKFPYGISSGATKIRPEESDLIKLFKRADKAAYKAKSEGKGRFCVQ